jgi:hypothetical protein
VRNNFALLVGFLVLSYCTNATGSREDEKRISGFYILERVDGAVLPAALSPEQGCNRIVRKVGTLSLSAAGPDVQPMYDWSFVIDVDCQPVPEGVFQGAADVGTWRVYSTQLSFSSMMAKGIYGAVVDESPANPPAVTLEYLGNSYRFRRVDDPTGVVFVKVVDQFGQPVAGVQLLFAFPYGLEGGGTTPASGEFGTGGHVGECKITITPPPGYEVPPSQPNPFSVVVVEGPALRVQVTLTKT